MDQLIDKTLSRITKDDVQPVPKWVFVVKRILWHLATVASIVLAGLSMAMFYLEYVSFDYEMINRADQGSFGWLILALPWAWLGLFIILMVVAYLDFRKSRYGYRYRSGYLIIALAVCALLTGLVIQFTHWQERTSEVLAEYPVYNFVFSPRAQVWQKPDDCLLAGKVLDFKNDMIEVRDIQGRVWRLVLSENTILPKDMDLNNCRMVKIICRRVGDTFVIDEIRLWHGADRGQRKLHK